jgi:RNA polymerase sigma-70 factor, ECF subfamily
MKISDENVFDDAINGEDAATPEQPFAEDDYSSLMPGEAYSAAREADAEQIDNEVIALLKQHAPALMRYATRIVRDKAIAQDAIQEVFFRYFITRAEGKQIENPHAWLFRVLTNYLSDCIRKSRSMPEAELKAAAEVADLRQDVESGYQQSEAIQCALASLSLRERQCLQLRLEGFGYDEIAKILNIQTGTVGALLARCLKKVRKTGLLSGRQR